MSSRTRLPQVRGQPPDRWPGGPRSGDARRPSGQPAQRDDLAEPLGTEGHVEAREPTRRGLLERAVERGHHLRRITQLGHRGQVTPAR
eukprot:13102811-Alexandrium_andersonii.AAC.1